MPLKVWHNIDVNVYYAFTIYSFIKSQGTVTAGEEVVSTIPGPMDVLCVNNWIILSQRFDGSLDFDRNWTDYKQGFGNSIAGGNFWLGLERMHQLTTSASYRLRFLLQADSTGQWYYADYDGLVVDSEVHKYRWYFGNYSGDAGDALMHYETDSVHVLQDMMFTTCDSDNDNSVENCGCKFSSGWWFNNCFWASTTGIYGTGDYCWYPNEPPTALADNGQLSASLMMIRKL